MSSQLLVFSKTFSFPFLELRGAQSEREGERKKTKTQLERNPQKPNAFHLFHTRTPFAIAFAPRKKTQVEKLITIVREISIPFRLQRPKDTFQSDSSRVDSIRIEFSVRVLMLLLLVLSTSRGEEGKTRSIDDADEERAGGNKILIPEVIL